MTLLTQKSLFLAILLSCFAVTHSEIPMLANGDATGYYIAPDSTLYVWGINNHGQLGLGHRDTTFFATRVDKSKWIWVSSQDSFAVAIKADSTLWAWGQNNRGQLGVGDTLERWVPTQVGNAKWRKVNTAGGIGGNLPWAFGLQVDSTMWTWGGNAWITYQGDSLVHVLGHSDHADQWFPKQVNSRKWLDVAAFSSHAIALDTDSLLWGWGYNSRGNLGDTTTKSDSLCIHIPKKITGEQKWTSIWAGSGTSMMQAQDSSIWAMGEYSGAILGNDPNRPIVSPKQIIAESPLKMASGYNRSLAIAPDSTLWAWGYYSSSPYINVYIGNSGNNSSTFGSPINTESHWKAISIGNNTSSVMRSDGAIFWWGDILKYSYWGHEDDLMNMARDKENVFVSAGLASVSLSWDTRVYFDTLSAVVTHSLRSAVMANGPRIDKTNHTLLAPGMSGTVDVISINGKQVATLYLQKGQVKLPLLPQGLYVLRLPNGFHLRWINTGLY